MANLTPPPELIEALGTQNITPERERLVTLLLKKAQNVNKDMFDTLTQIKEVLLRFEPGVAEDWLECFYKGLRALRGEPYNQPRMRSTLCDAFAGALMAQIETNVTLMKEQIDSDFAGDQAFKKFNYGRAIILKWQPLLEFYSQNEEISPRILEDMRTTHGLMEFMRFLTEHV